MKKLLIEAGINLLLLATLYYSTFAFFSIDDNATVYFYFIPLVLLSEMIITYVALNSIKNAYFSYKRQKENQIIHEELAKAAMDELESHNIRVIEVSSDDTIETLFEKIRSSSNMEDRTTKTSGLPNTITDCKNALKRAKTQSEVDRLLERLQELRNK
jgi:hypothetical protein